ncbi:MAG: GH32 C-terminal domain-containing protein [Verrucomicrobia bacterium]|nr:GH32 C-terminal domain-containing protein [Verrucomicrobiota bacterium]
MRKSKNIIGSITLSAVVLTVWQVELRAEGVLHHDAAAISKAMEGMEKAISIARNAPSRPVDHLLPEAQWMNDPNGAFFADGWCQVFYQFNLHEGGTLDVFGTKVAISSAGAGKTLALQVFLDKSIMEVFINGGKKTVARVLYPPLEDKGRVLLHLAAKPVITRQWRFIEWLAGRLTARRH